MAPSRLYVDLLDLWLNPQKHERTIMKTTENIWICSGILGFSGPDFATNIHDGGLADRFGII